MNLRTILNSTLGDKPLTDAWTQAMARINLIWRKQHDPETGAHTNITAISAVIGTLTVTGTATIATLVVTTLAVTNLVASTLTVLSTATFNGLVSLVSGQIQFPATQVPSTNPNTLDDYEEGSWTPTDGSGAGLAITGNGSYVKIGKMVFVRGIVVYPVTANAAAAVITGLPFTIANLQGQGLALSFTSRLTTFTVYARENTVNLEFLNLGAGGATNASLSGSLSGFCGTYQATQ